MITDQQFIDSASFLNIPVASIKAVAEVESSGQGFIDGKPVILFEPHIFYRELKNRGINPDNLLKGNEDILYPKWGTRPYPSGQIAKWIQLNKAIAINKDAARASASWGKFQVCGFNYKSCGCASLDEFVSDMMESEDKHLYRFTLLVHSFGIDKYLRNQDWANFAKSYNGAAFRKNNYDVKLANAYKKYC